MTRVWDKIKVVGDHWMWTGAYAGKEGLRYGTIQIGSRADGTRKKVKVYKLLYERLVGPIPDGLLLDHLCKITLCVNPEHMEPVTPAENVRRGDQAKRQRETTHCPQGHPYEGENLGITVTKSGLKLRYCRLCKTLRSRKDRER